MFPDLGKILSRQREHADAWFYALLVFLAALLGLNLVFHPHHPHFPGESVPGFWPLFGLGSTLVMVLVLKKLVARVLGRKENLYDE